MTRTTRPITLSTRGMVASPHYLATAAGQHILREGGSAVDAAIAVNATLGVVYPHMTGMGGDAFWLIHAAGDKCPRALNGSGRAVAAATRDWYHERGFAAIPTRGAFAALTVPGTVDSWCAAHARHGRLPLAAVLAPAISHARDGYPVSAGQARFTAAAATMLAGCRHAHAHFLPAGQAPAVGTVMRFPRLADTMERVARHGRAGFYEGDVAEEIVRHMNDAGGAWHSTDLAGHESSWETAASTTYRGLACYQAPPNSQGFAHLMALNLLERFDVAALKTRDADYVHLLVAATQCAFTDRDRYLTDPLFSDIPLQRLLSKAYAAERGAGIGLDTDAGYRAAPMGGDTTATVVVDDHGNAVSMIQSLYHEFGAGVVAGETGVLLQNRGAFFSLDADHVNCLEPGKRSFHTLMPGMAYQNGAPYLVYGTMGGEGQPQTSTALLTRIWDFGLDPQAAIDAPRWLFGRTWGAETQGLRLESRFAPEIGASLAERGHDVETVEAWSDVMGHAAAILIDPGNGVLHGAADARGEGIALGW